MSTRGRPPKIKPVAPWPRVKKPTYEIHHNTFDNKPAMDAIIAIANALAALAERLPKGPQLQIGWPPEAP